MASWEEWLGKDYKTLFCDQGLRNAVFKKHQGPLCAYFDSSFKAWPAQDPSVLQACSIAQLCDPKNESVG